MDPQRRPKRRPTKKECYTIQQAVENNDITMLKEMITHGVDVNCTSAKDKSGLSTTPLHLAVKHGNNDIVHLLLEEGADINAKDFDGKTPLHQAVIHGSEDMVKFLVEKGADVNVVDHRGDRPLLYAVRRGSEDMVKFLVEKGAYVNVVDWIDATPLHQAIIHGSEDMVKFLVEKGANVDVGGLGGDTPLHQAVMHGSEDMVKFLVEKGADVNAVDHLGRSPLHYAVEYGSEDMVKFLVEKGANVNIVDYDGQTPLHQAVRRDSEDMVKFLVEKGANVSVVDWGGDTPLHQAVMHGSEDMVKFLVEKGANVNVVDHSGKTPFELAVEEGYSRVVSYFFKELHMDTSQFDEETKKKIRLLLDKAIDGLSVEDVNKSYMDGELHGPDVRVALLGAEGSGKTCLSHTLVGKDYQDTPPTEGADHMEIVVESTTDWQPLTYEEKLDDLEEQKCLEAMFVSSTKRQRHSSILPDRFAAMSSHGGSSVPASMATSTVPFFNTQGSSMPIYPSSAHRPHPPYPTSMPVQPLHSIPTSMFSNPVFNTPATTFYPTAATFMPQVYSRQPLPPVPYTPSYFTNPPLSTFASVALTNSFPSLHTNTPLPPSYFAHNANLSATMLSTTTSVTMSTPIPTASLQIRTVQGKNQSSLSSNSISKVLYRKNELYFSVSKFRNLKAIKERYNPNKRYINIWDFAGQAVFQHTHGVFVSDEVVCLIVFDASLALDEVPERRYPHDHTPRRTVLQTICYWMELISSRVSKPSTSDKDHSVRLPTFILVGTHIDKLHSDIAKAEKIAFDKFVPVFKEELVGKPFSLHIAGSKKGNLFKTGSPSLFFVCNKQRVDTIINKLKQVTLQSASITRQTRPTCYVEVERKLMLLSMQEKVYIIGLSELAEVAKSCGLPSSDEKLLQLTEYFHHKGALLHYHKIPSLANTIILSPHWMAKLLTYVLTSLICWPTDPQLDLYAKKRQKKGLLEEELIDWSVEQFNKSEAPRNRIAVDLHGVPVVELFTKFLLMVDITQSSLADKTFRGKGKKLFLVPHLLPCKELPPSQAASLKFLFYFPTHFIPDNLVDQLIVKCAQWNNHRHYDLLWLSYQWVCLNLGQYQVYEVKPVDQHHYIELTIIPDPAMPQEDELKSFKESRDLITAVKGFINDLMKEHMTAVAEKSPVECYIPCPGCNELHIKMESLPNTGRYFCFTKRDYCDLSAYCKVLSAKGSPTQLTRGIPIQRPPTIAQRPTMNLIKEYIIPKIAAWWKDVADFLEFDNSTIERIQQDNPNNCSKCLDSLFRDWLGTNHGVGPKTWATLLEKLKKIETLATATSDIERELKILGIL